MQASKFTINDYNILYNDLKKMADQKYKEFHSKLIPGIHTDFLGIRVPELRKVARRLKKEDFRGFLSYAKDSDTYEIIMLTGMIIGLSQMDFEEKMVYLDEFVPKIDNWAVCDVVVGDLKDIIKNRDKMYKYIQKYLKSVREYELRFAIVVLMQYYLVDDYIDDVLSIYNTIKHEGYYVKMAIAWSISVCFVKYRDKTIKFLKNCNLDDFTYNKALQKIRESNRVSKEDKEMVKEWKR